MNKWFIRSQRTGHSLRKVRYSSGYCINIGTLQLRDKGTAVRSLNQTRRRLSHDGKLSGS